MEMDMRVADSALNAVEGKGKKKRKRGKSSEEVERQRMIHIAVERNRRKQMNDHLQILRSLMPTYYTNRGDQASIVGAAIEFVRELEQLVECLESVKRQEAAAAALILQTAESKSWLADVEVSLSGLFAFIKIVSTRRRGHIVNIVAALHHLHLHILQTNITTTLQDLVCSFTLKMSGQAMLTAQDIANSIQQILMNSSLHNK